MLGSGVASEIIDKLTMRDVIAKLGSISLVKRDIYPYFLYKSSCCRLSFGAFSANFFFILYGSMLLYDKNREVILKMGLH